jgi:hypothetical protein
MRAWSKESQAGVRHSSSRPCSSPDLSVEKDFACLDGSRKQLPHTSDDSNRGCISSLVNRCRRAYCRTQSRSSWRAQQYHNFAHHRGSRLRRSLALRQSHGWPHLRCHSSGLWSASWARFEPDTDLRSASRSAQPPEHGLHDLLLHGRRHRILYRNLELATLRLEWRLRTRWAHDLARSGRPYLHFAIHVQQFTKIPILEREKNRGLR